MKNSQSRISESNSQIKLIFFILCISSWNFLYDSWLLWKQCFVSSKICSVLLKIFEQFSLNFSSFLVKFSNNNFASFLMSSCKFDMKFILSISFSKQILLDFVGADWTSKNIEKIGKMRIQFFMFLAFFLVDRLIQLDSWNKNWWVEE